MAKIFLAEDDTALRHYITGVLQKAGHVVEGFDNGQDAHQALLSAPCDLLLTDIVMPGMDGIELSKRASALYPALPVIYITGFAGSLLEEQKGYATKIISKPFHLGTLAGQVEDILSRQKAT
jgi:two-component system, cell cycle response regulator CpdR